MKSKIVHNGFGDIQDFNDVNRDYGLSKMNFVGLRFTWSRKNGEELIVERLDRGFENDAFREKYAYSYVKHVQASSSDHLPMVIYVSSKSITEAPKKRLFRFENMWIRHVSCEEVVRSGWGVKTKRKYAGFGCWN